MRDVTSQFAANRGWIPCVFATYLLASCSGAAEDPNRTILEREGSIKGLVREEVSVDARAGDVLLAVLQQSGLDLYLEHSNPPGGKSVTFESFTGRYGEERVVITVAADGVVRLAFGSDRLPNVSGRYKLTVTRSPAADKGDAAYSEASRKEDALDLAKRLALLDESVRQYSLSRETRNEGLAALASVNLLNEGASDWKRAIVSGERAAAAFRAVNAATLRASAANSLAWAYAEAGSADRMSESFAEAALAYESASSSIGKLEVDLYRVSAPNSGLTAADKLDALERIAQGCGALQEIVCQAQALASSGSLHLAGKNYGKALGAMYASMSLVDAEADPATYAQQNDNLAYSLRRLGDYDGAIQHLRVALASYSKFGECSGVSRTLYGLGYTLLGIGDHEQALRFYQLALSRRCTVEQLSSAPPMAGVHQSISEMCTRAEGPVLENEADLSIATWATYDLGGIALAASEPEVALQCHELSQKLAEQRTNADGDRFGAKLEQVRDLLELERTDDAQTRYDESMRAESKAADASYLAQAEEVGAMLLGAHDDPAAYEKFRLAAESMRKEKNLEGVYSALRRRAALAGRLGDSRADQFYADADAALEDVRMLSFDPTFSASLFASGRKIYEEWVDSSLATTTRGTSTERALRALAISERSRARLLSQVTSTYQAGAEARSVRMRFLAGETADSLAAAEHGRVLKAQPAVVVRSAAETKPPDSAREKFDEPAIRSSMRRLQDFQRTIDSNVTVVEYLLGPSRSHAWIIRRDQIAMVELPGEAFIRDAVTKARDALQRGAAIEEIKATTGPLLEILIRPLDAQIRGDRLDIVADDVLHEIPFSALWDAGTKQFLVERFSLTYLPSISYSANKQAKPAASSRQAALLIGDPVYELGDAASRCAKFPRGRDGNTQTISLQRIPASGREVQAIEAVFRDLPDQLTVLTGCSANRNRVLESPSTQFRYVHFATHATADRVVPQRSAIYLSAFDDQGRQVPSELTATDLLGRSFDADLVVLSGCTTAGGRQYRGEGALGLPFSLIAAGSRQVLSTLWPVADAASVSAMEEFYRVLVSDGRDASTALRAAQLRMLESKRWSHPRHWAAYTLLGT